MKSIGVNAEYVASGGSFFTVENRILHLREARAGESVFVTSRVAGFENKTLRLAHELWREGDDESGDGALAVGEQTLVHVDLQSRRASPPAPSIAAAASAARARDAALPPIEALAPPPLTMDFGLSNEQRALVDAVRAFVEREIYPHENAVEKSGEVPPELGAAIRQKCLAAGFYAANMPVEAGGGGLSHLDCALLERELGRGSAALTVFFGRPSNILLACVGAQREKYLLPAARGEKIDALAMTEPAAGSDLRGIRCAARKDGDDWILNGGKHFISHADIADFFVVFVASGEAEISARRYATSARAQTLTAFLVDRATPGFSVLPGYESVSHRGYQNGVLAFSDCRLPAAQVLGAPDRGFDIANEWLYSTRLAVAAACVGRARRAFALALEHAAQRKQFGQNIGRFQAVGNKIADMATAIDAADFLTLSAAWRLDQGLPANREIAQAKLFAAETLARVTDESLQIFGGMGLMRDFAVGAILARRASRAHLGRNFRNPTPHHRPRFVAPARRMKTPAAPDLTRLLRPRSIAVCGGAWARNVEEQCAKMGFAGEIWTVNPRRAAAGEPGCFSSIADLPRAPDAAFVGVNREAAIEAVAELARAGAGGAVCFAAGFGEAGREANWKIGLSPPPGRCRWWGPIATASSITSTARRCGPISKAGGAKRAGRRL